MWGHPCDVFISISHAWSFVSRVYVIVCHEYAECVIRESSTDGSPNSSKQCIYTREGPKTAMGFDQLFLRGIL